MVDSVGTVFRKVIVLSLIVVALIAIIGSAIGFFVAGEAGVISALIGALVALLFSTFTVLSFWVGHKLPLGGYFGVVLGGWLLKFVVFAIALTSLRGADFISGPVFFFSLVSAIVGGLAVDAWVVSKARMTIEGNS
jgi:hypothetical protein